MCTWFASNLFVHYSPTEVLRVVVDVHQDEDGHVPEAFALQLSCVAAVQEALSGGAQVSVVQRLKDAPQVPAESVVQTLPGDAQRVEQLLQAVVSVGGGRERDRERDRDRDRERERETERDRERGRQRARVRQRESERERESETESETW